jgi:predicted AAA+ superfamily ATPase
VFYWRERNREVDFVLRAGKRVTAIEVKSGRGRDALPGVSAFRESFRPQRILLVGGDGIPLDRFLSTPVSHWLSG